MNSLVYIQFGVAILLPVLATGVVYRLTERTKFGKLSYSTQQVLIGILFGAIAIYGTEFGIQTTDAAMNVRDAAPITAGLLFGGPAGIIAGLIGGIERWLCVYWGGGTFTRVGCTVATILVGLGAACLRKYIFDDKRPSWAMAFMCGLVAEVCHLMLIFFTNTAEVERAIVLVEACFIPMTVCNAVSVMLSTMLMSWLTHSRVRLAFEERPVAQQVQLSMLWPVLLAFVATIAFTTALQTGIADSQAANEYNLTIEDVTSDIRANPNKPLSELANHRRVGTNGTITLVDDEGNAYSSDPLLDGQSIDSSGLGNVFRNSEAGKIFRIELFGRQMYAFYKQAGTVTILVMQPYEEVRFTRDATVLVSAMVETLVFAILFLIVYILIKRLVVDNIHHVNDALGTITNGDLEAKVEVNSNMEFTELSTDINLMVGALRQAIADEAARIDADLEYARTIQRSALPRIFPPFPSRTEFEIFASMDAAKEVGGDFYDFYFVDDNHLAFTIADVSGKGIPGALFMMTSKTLIKQIAETGVPVDEVLTRANDELCANNDAEMFVTCWMGVIDLETGHVTYVIAGHNPPAIGRAGQKYEYLQTKPNFVLAGMEGIRYRSHELDLSPGDTIFLYTDGVTEGTNADEELFGEDRLLWALDEHAADDVESLCNGVHHSVDAFVGDAPQFDDITVLALRYLGGNDHGRA